MDYRKVPAEVERLCRRINEKLPAAEAPEDIYRLAFDAHFGLVSIHPFADGNGRVSRLLMNYILAYHNQPLAIIFSEDKAEYYNALETSRNENSMQTFHEFMFSRQEKYFNLELKKLEQYSNRQLP